MPFHDFKAKKASVLFSPLQSARALAMAVAAREMRLARAKAKGKNKGKVKGKSKGTGSKRPWAPVTPPRKEGLSQPPVAPQPSQGPRIYFKMGVKKKQGQKKTERSSRSRSNSFRLRRSWD